MSLRAKKPSLCVLTDTLARSGRGTLVFTWPVFWSARTTFFLVSRKIRAVPCKPEDKLFTPLSVILMLCHVSTCKCTDYNGFFKCIFRCPSDLETETRLRIKHNTHVQTRLLSAGTTTIMPVVRMSKKKKRLLHSCMKYPSKQL